MWLKFASFCLIGLAFWINSAVALSGYKTENVEINPDLISDLSFQNKLPKRLSAKLYLPVDAQKQHGVVIILPSSASIQPSREIYYAKELASHGIAALTVDSLGSRGLSSIIYNQLAVTTADYELDAFLANKYLLSDKRIDGQKIGVMGVSKGGTTAHFLAMNIRRKWRHSEKIQFAAYASLSPACYQYHHDNTTDGHPIFFMLPELDDGSPTKDCMVIINNLKNAGNHNVTYKVYKGVYHSWETAGPFFEKNDMMANHCYYTMSDDAKIVPNNTGVPMTGPEWEAWAAKTCMHKGVTSGGGSPEFKRQATDDLIGFFTRAGFKDGRGGTENGKLTGERRPKQD